MSPDWLLHLSAGMFNMGGSAGFFQPFDDKMPARDFLKMAQEEKRERAVCKAPMTGTILPQLLQ